MSNTDQEAKTAAAEAALIQLGFATDPTAQITVSWQPYEIAISWWLFKAAPSPISLSPPSAFGATAAGGANGGMVHFNQNARQQPLQQQQMFQYVQIPGKFLTRPKLYPDTRKSLILHFRTRNDGCSSFNWSNNYATIATCLSINKSTFVHVQENPFLFLGFINCLDIYFLIVYFCEFYYGAKYLHKKNHLWYFSL